jgi:hypothetical protein
MPTVVVTITCDWEGEKLEPSDLKAMKVLNTKLELFSQKLGQGIPITHFICPAYFTRTDVEVDRQMAADVILKSGAIKVGDEIAAHVHCWKSLSQEAGIDPENFEETPLGTPPNSQPAVYRKGSLKYYDIGYTVPFGIYGKGDVKKFLVTTVNLLKTYLKADAVSFRCGMWVTCDVIFEALVETQLKNDASGIPFGYMNSTVRNFFGRPLNLIEWNVKIWGATPSNAPQYVKNTRSLAQYPSGIEGMGDAAISEPKSVNGIVEVPDTATLVPITNQALMVVHIDRAFEIAETTGKDVYISLGFHQEDCGEEAFFAPKGYPLTKEEEDIRLNGLLGAIARIVAKSIRAGFAVEFIKKDDLADSLRRRNTFATSAA